MKVGMKIAVACTILSLVFSLVIYTKYNKCKVQMDQFVESEQQTQFFHLTKESVQDVLNRCHEDDANFIDKTICKHADELKETGDSIFNKTVLIDFDKEGVMIYDENSH